MSWRFDLPSAVPRDKRSDEWGIFSWKRSIFLYISLSLYTVRQTSCHIMKTTDEKKPKCSQRIARERFRERKNCLFKKAYEVGKLYQTDVYLVLYRNHRFYTYNSRDEASWPSFEKQIVDYLHNSREFLWQCQDESFPLPNRKKPCDFMNKLSSSKSPTKAAATITTIEMKSSEKENDGAKNQRRDRQQRIQSYRWHISDASILQKSPTKIQSTFTFFHLW